MHSNGPAKSSQSAHSANFRVQWRVDRVPNRQVNTVSVCRFSRLRYVRAYIAYLTPTGQWAGLQGVGMVEEERRVGLQVSTECRYYILSRPLAARSFGDAVRNHWGVENRVHWILDVAFREDESRIRTDHSPANMAILRHMALNLLTQERSAKVGTKAKRLKAGWDPAYLLMVLQAN